MLCGLHLVQILVYSCLSHTMSDSVAEKSGFLKTYMNNHPDTLVAYAKWFGKVSESISSAEMTAIDSKVCRNETIAIPRVYLCQCY